MAKSPNNPPMSNENQELQQLLRGECTSNGVPESLESVSEAYDERIHSWFSAIERKTFRFSSFVEVNFDEFCPKHP